ncbi:cytochrome P450 [Streptomyces iconiensis]|uniref:Cytochrome P450 n=1 Tax=Streptomyces iconiensis TaxID=1384038 RepID=A0ABT7A7L7_9ACTN|nr:cytochrome P450 [Streptomyces iconiensis]MDJ1137325.1 cytochrome P450 [Streptomyces iconiensis]
MPLVPAPAPGGLPLLGHAPQMLRRRLAFLESLRELGPAATIRLGRGTVTVLNDHRLVRDVLSARAGDFGLSPHFRVMKRIIGNGLLATDGSFHRRQRKLLMPALRQSRMRAYAEIMSDLAQRHLDGLRGTAQPVDVDRILMALATETVTRCLFSTGVAQHQVDRVAEAVPVLMEWAGSRGMDPTGLLAKLPTPLNRRFRDGMSALDTLVGGLIAERCAGNGRVRTDEDREAGEDSGVGEDSKDRNDDGVRDGRGDRDEVGDPEGRGVSDAAAGVTGPAGTEGRVEQGDLLDAMLRATDAATGERMPERQVHDEAMSFLIASTESVSRTLTWALHLLARDPDVRAKLHAEVDAVLAGRTARWEDIPRLPYTRHVLSEVLRLYPPGYLISRTAARDTVVRAEGAGELPLAEGAMVMFSYYALQRDPRLFPEPGAFRPERWESGEAACPGGAARQAFLPFGLGPHGCLGEGFAWTEMTLVLASLAARWELRAVGEEPPRAVAAFSLSFDDARMTAVPRVPGPRGEAPRCPTAAPHP